MTWPPRQPRPGRDRGIAFVDSFGMPVAEVVEVTKTDKGIRIDKVFAAVDVGRIVDPVNFDNHVKGAVVWALGHAMNCETTYADGMAQQTNLPLFAGMRLDQCPQIVVRGLKHSPRVRGVGEPPVPPAAPALAAAIFAATGTCEKCRSASLSTSSNRVLSDRGHRPVQYPGR